MNDDPILMYSIYFSLSLLALALSLSLSIESHTSSNVFHFPWNSRFRVASSLHHYQSDVVMVFTNNVLNWLISVNLPVFCVQITPSSDVCWYLPRWWQYFTINNIMIWRFEERSIVRDSLETVIIIVLYFHFNFWFWCWIFRSFHRIQRHRTGFANFFLHSVHWNCGMHIWLVFRKECVCAPNANTIIVHISYVFQLQTLYLFI